MIKAPHAGYGAAHSFLLLLALLMLRGCEPGMVDDAVLNDFESDADLDAVRWTCGRLYALSENHATSGQKSLVMTLYPAAYPGLALRLRQTDWRGFTHLCMDIFNPQPETLSITIRVDDREEYPPYADRFNQSFSMAPGNNHLEIPLNSLITSGSRRPLDLENIRRFLFFMVDTKQIYHFHVDNIRLVNVLSFNTVSHSITYRTTVHVPLSYNTLPAYCFASSFLVASSSRNT
ncbi:MAG: hypothetical protein ACOZF0_00630 [Thermodesulfobacteriota bacterium]